MIRTAAVQQRRRGAVLVAMLALLAVVMVLTSNWIRRVVDDRQQIRRHLIELQATRLAEGGVQRARAELAQDPNYTGELWEIAADSREFPHAASVQITVKPEDSAVGGVQVTARATYPEGDDRAVHRTRTARFHNQSDQP